ncbi:hypothetical protein FKW77_009449 [Venturia effusa]|uniref:Uncharacterized protein n=1 Tax=Venturia effusa TaxID=50376 RepID=A0A517L203_9PEZI|nr:hypothetical protein FKW77_009449 [Venturia effusa]
MAVDDEGSDDGRAGRVPILNWAPGADRQPRNLHQWPAHRTKKRQNVDFSPLSERWDRTGLAPQLEVTTDRGLLSSIKGARRRRDIVLGKRVFVLNQRTSYRYQRDAAHKARNKFLLAAKNLRSRLEKQGIDTGSCVEYKYFEDAFAELGVFNQNLDKMENKLQEADKDLDKGESKLSVEEKKVYNALTRYVEHSPSRPLIVSEPPKMPSLQSSSDSSSSSDSEPLAEEYYGAAGTVKILHDRLHNRQIQHLQDESVRQIDMELGKTLHPPEKEFRKGYLIGLSALYAELLKAKKRSTSLKKACKEAEIDLEADGESRSCSEALHLTPEFERRLIRHAAALDDTEEQKVLLTNFFSGYMDPKTKVSDWLVDLPQRDSSDSLEFPEIKHLGDKRPSQDSEVVAPNAPSSRIYPDYSNNRTSMVPDISSDQARIDGMLDWSVRSSRKLFPINDFAGKAPDDKRRYSDSRIERPAFTSLEDMVLFTRWVPKRPNSAIAAFTLNKGARYDH